MGLETPVDPGFWLSYRWTKTLLESSCAAAEFVALLSQHVPDRYQQSMRYFGLMAPLTKRPQPRRLSWRSSLLRDFHADPLRDSHGQTMTLVRCLRRAVRYQFLFFLEIKCPKCGQAFDEMAGKKPLSTS